MKHYHRHRNPDPLRHAEHAYFSGGPAANAAARSAEHEWQRLRLATYALGEEVP